MMITDDTIEFEKIENEVNKNEKLSILNKLLSQSFDKRINDLELNSNEHFAVISSGIALTNVVCSLCTNIIKRIKPRPATTPAKRSFTPSRISLGNKKTNTNNYNKIRPKTPSKGLTNNKSMSKLMKTPLKEKKLITSKSNGFFLKSRSKTPSRIMSKSSLFSTTNGNIDHKSINIMQSFKNNSNNHNNSFYSTTANKSMMSKLSNVSNPSASKIYKKIEKNKNDNNNNNRPIGLKKQNVIQKQQLPLETENNETNNEIPNNISKISLMESNMQDEYHIKNEDALLVSQNNELDLVQMKKLNDVEELIKNKYKQLIHFNIYEFITQHFSLLSLYLNQQELINLMLVNKQFFKQVKYNLISELEKHKQKYEQKINEYKDEIIDDPGTPILKPSRGTTKATDLLNGPPLNKIFTEGNKIPNNDILRIYCLYFQIIKHKNAKNYPLNKELFWENACNYFTKEHEGKTGQLLAKNIKEDVDLSNENLYYILKILDGNVDKINPGYFSKICGTTGLFAFLIKDVLDCFGLSGDKNVHKKRYCTHKKMVNVLERKIDKVKAILK